MTKGTGFEKRDGVIAAAFLLGALLMRIPFRSQYAYYWDTAQFALAIRGFNVALHHPHPPGYFLYVMLARLVNGWVGDPQASLVWLSVFAGAALAALGYLLGTALFDRWRGVAAGAILASSPLCWFYSEIGMTSIVDAALVAATILAGWRAVRRGGTWTDVVWLSVLMIWVAGTRPQTGPTLLPAWLWCFWKFEKHRARKLAAGLTLTGLGCLAWIVPMIARSGGWKTYWSFVITQRWVYRGLTLAGGGPRALLHSLTIISASCLMGLLLATALVAAELVCWVFFTDRTVKNRWYAQHRMALELLAWWIGAMVVFGSVIYYTAIPGYVLGYFPALALLAALAVCRWGDRMNHWWAGLNGTGVSPSPHRGRLLALGLVVAANSGLFLFGPAETFSRQDALAVTAPVLRAHDRRLGNWFAIIRARYRPDEVIIYHYGICFAQGFCHFQLHLPEYRNVQLMPDRSMPGELARKQRLGYHDHTWWIDQPVMGPARVWLLYVPPDGKLSFFQEYFPLTKARVVPHSGGHLYEIPAEQSPP